MALVVAGSVVFLGLVSVFVKLARRLGATPPIPLTPERNAELSIDAANLLRLLDEEVQSFYAPGRLHSQIGSQTRYPAMPTTARPLAAVEERFHSHLHGAQDYHRGVERRPA
jgi:hypothetical protein